MMKPDVAISRCAKYGEQQVLEAITASIDLLGGINAFVRPGERILIKPNLLAGKPPEAAVTTHPAVVKALIELVTGAGAVAIVGDSPGIGDATRIAEKCGIIKVCRRTGTEFVDLKTLTLVKNRSGGTFKRIEVAAEALEVDGIINLPKLKTHAQMLLTMGVKNIFGCVCGKRKPQWHLTAGVDVSYFAAMILDLYRILSPRLTVMDAIVAMDGNGPVSGDPKPCGLIFASVDALALDTIASVIVGAEPMDVPILKRAREEGLTTGAAEDIRVLGTAVDEARVSGFRLPPLVHTSFTAGLPGFIDRHLRKALTTRPFVHNDICTLCGTCTSVCPAGVMLMTDRIDIDYDRCIRCFCCQEVCPDRAILVKEGWLKRLMPGL